jgi:hypothetical protein
MLVDRSFTNQLGAIVIERVGASGPSRLRARIDVETAEGPTVLSLSTDAAFALAKELSIWLRFQGQSVR